MDGGSWKRIEMENATNLVNLIVSEAGRRTFRSQRMDLYKSSGDTSFVVSSGTERARVSI